MKEFIKKTLLVIAALILGIALCEVFLILFYPQPMGRVSSGELFFIDYDPDTGWVNRKNAEGFHNPVPGEPGGYIKINAKNLRGSEHPYERTPGKKRVLATGDSLTFGYAMEERFSYPAQLQELLGNDYEVINAGIIGSGTDQQFLFFQKEGFKYHPDLVIVGFSAGDIYDGTCSMRFGASKPFFEIVNNNLVLRDIPVPRSSPVPDVLLREKPIQASLFRNSHLFRLLFYRLTDPNRIHNINIEEMNVFEGTRVVSGILGQFRNECERLDCALLFVVIPQEDWLSAAKEHPESEPFVKRGHLAATGILMDAGIPFLDLWEPFKRELPNRLFLKGDPIHPNQRGNEVIARELFQWLIAHPQTFRNTVKE